MLTVVVCGAVVPFLLQIFPGPRIVLILGLLCWQVISLLLVPLGKPILFEMEDLWFERLDFTPLAQDPLCARAG